LTCDGLVPLESARVARHRNEPISEVRHGDNVPSAHEIEETEGRDGGRGELPLDLMQALTHQAGGRIVLVLGAGCSPSFPLAESRLSRTPQRRVYKPVSAIPGVA